MASTSATGAAAPENGYLTGFGAKPYRTYVLTSLTVVYIFNFIDRGLLSVVGPAIKPELGISDTLFGLLTGVGFALLYSIVGIPVAAAAETKNRVTIMAVCVAIWSVMTALCGLANPITIGGFTLSAVAVLFLCRMGVGVGEAGCTPPASSLIADYYPPKSRSTALGFYAMGVTLGTVMANLIGGPVTDAFGWRYAFFVLGLPGLIIAVILKLTIKEPPRGYTDPPGTIRREKASFFETLKELTKKPSFWTMAAGVTLAAFSGYGIANFQSVFINREFGLTAGQAAIQVNVPVYAASALGTLLTGWLAQRMYSKYPGAIAWIPGIGLILCVPFYWLAFTTHNFQLALFGLVAGGFIKYGYLAAQYTIGQGVVSARARATATAILLFIINALGYSFGPPFIGVISDAIFNSKLKAATDLVGEFTRKSCEGKLLSHLDDAQKAFCAANHSSALQQSMLITAMVYGLGGVMLLLSWRTLSKDMVAR